MGFEKLNTHSGRLRTSDNPDGSTCFRFELPVRSESVVAAA